MNHHEKKNEFLLFGLFSFNHSTISSRKEDSHYLSLSFLDFLRDSLSFFFFIFHLIHTNGFRGSRGFARFPKRGGERLYRSQNILLGFRKILIRYDPIISAGAYIYDSILLFLLILFFSRFLKPFVMISLIGLGRSFESNIHFSTSDSYPFPDRMSFISICGRFQSIPCFLSSEI